MRSTIAIAALLISASTTATASAYTDPVQVKVAAHARHTTTAQAARACHTKHLNSAFCQARSHRHAIRVVATEVFQEERRAGVQHWRHPRLNWDLDRLTRQNRHWRSRLRLVSEMPTWHSSNPVTAIMAIFGSDGPDAIKVFTCESGLSRRAVNGQYLGIAQMGSYARAKYGHGSDVWTQVSAAHDYFLDAGWSPWSCAYITGVL